MGKELYDIEEIPDNKSSAESIEDNEDEIGGTAFFENNRNRALKEKPSRKERDKEFDIISRWEEQRESEDHLLNEISILMNAEQKLKDSEKVTKEHELEAEYIRQHMDMNMEKGANARNLLEPLTKYIENSKFTQESARKDGKMGELPKQLDYALREHGHALDFNENKRLVYRWVYYKNGEHIPYLAETGLAINKGDYVTTRQFISTSSHKRFIHGIESNTRVGAGEKGPRTFVKMAIITRYGVPIGNAVYRNEASADPKIQWYCSAYTKKNYGDMLETCRQQVKDEKKKLKIATTTLSELEKELEAKQNYNKTKKMFYEKKLIRPLKNRINGMKKKWEKLNIKLEEAEKKYLKLRTMGVGQAEVLMNRWAVLEVKSIKPIPVPGDNGEMYTDYEVILEEKDQAPTDKPIKEIFTGLGSAPQRRQSLDDFNAVNDNEQQDDIYRIPVDVPVSLGSRSDGQIDKLKKLLDAKQIVITEAGSKEVRKALDEDDKRTLNKYTVSRNASALVIVRDPEVLSEAGDELSIEDDDELKEEEIEENEEEREEQSERKPDRFIVPGFLKKMFNGKKKKN